MNRLSCSFVGCWVALQTVLAADATTTNSAEAFFFKGQSLPQPPQQHASWSPPESSIPSNYIEATKLLFEQGLADPRGCDYREIEVLVGSVWRGAQGVVKTRGWVLPGSLDQRFAVCWNGLVYPVIRVGAIADLDAEAMSWAQTASRPETQVSDRLDGISSTSHAIKGCLLLRLGKADVAKVYWLALEKRHAGHRGPPPLTPDAASSNELPHADPYLTWAGDWAWSLFERMICAHMRGDDRLALADAGLLAAVQPRIEAECARRGFQRERSWQDKLLPYLPFLDQFPRILDDLVRREKEGSRVIAISEGLTNVIDQAQRVRLLVRDLDQVQARQWSQPGGVHFAEDPIISALIAEGDAAVEPLLECLDQDKRLTRSVEFHRDFHRQRTVVQVSGAARYALRMILQTDINDSGGLRAHWDKYKHLSLEDRWYAILADDTARDRWREVAANIVQPEEAVRFPGGSRMRTPVPAAAAVKLRGETLRSKQGPSVSELMTRRALEVATENLGSYDITPSCEMADYLAQWDLQAALPVARTLSRRISTIMKYSDQNLGGYLAKFSVARAKAGDLSPFEEYAEWIATTTPERVDRIAADVFEPLKQFPSDPVLQAAAEKLFSPNNPAWGTLPWKIGFRWPTVDEKLLPVPGYRGLLCRELIKTNNAGTVTLERSDFVRYALLERYTGGFKVNLPSSCTATNGSVSSIRWGEWIALALSNISTNFTFDPFAPIEQKDGAIQAIIGRLEEQ